MMQYSPIKLKKKLNLNAAVDIYLFLDLGI